MTKVEMKFINVWVEVCQQHPSVLVTELMPPPIEIQEMIFILKIIEFFVSEKLFLLIFIKRTLGDIANNLIYNNAMIEQELTLTVKFADMNDGVVFVHTVEEFDGFKKENNEKVAAKVDYFGMLQGVLTAQLIELHDGIADLRAERSEGFTKGIFATLLKGAKIEVERELHEPGEPVMNFDGTQAVDEKGEPMLYKEQCYSTNIVGLKMTDKAEEKLQKQLDKISWV